ncbi:MAG: hypothetical protein LBO05_12580, partial [Deltaproteobacteria bacterium]|nr:hypothetical protein [Deltaproteobacteria bacterium]
MPSMLLDAPAILGRFKVLEAVNAHENRMKFYKEMAELLKKRLQNRSDIDHVRSLAILGMFFKMSFPDIP